MSSHWLQSDSRDAPTRTGHVQVPHATGADRLFEASSERPATLMYMTTVGVAELRQNLSKYLRLVRDGERLVVTERNMPVAELGPPPSSGQALDRLIAAGRLARPPRPGLPEPLQLAGDPHALSRALDEIRGER
jgi:prevent-host-death family protein